MRERGHLADLFFNCTWSLVAQKFAMTGAKLP
ncbi:hypothetical protein KC19_9G130400 [Ceratodon purpureus]|uniref:Uncharacterized protein n=1 Tax=Ceratodon purpureus TaxID=3225 RepID=A0A8T0GRH4_CERPU|nr:hypothetical protein KC19_9G130400 [Ceratodon purpureus]